MTTLELDADLGARLTAALGENTLARRQEMMRDREMNAAVSYLDEISFSFSSGNPTVLPADLRPKDGYVWAVQRFGVTGLNVANSTSTPTVANVPLAATTVASSNPNPVPVQVTVAGGTVTAIAINGTTTNATSGTFTLGVGGFIAITYSVAPTLTTAGIAVAITVPDQITIYRANSAAENVGQKALHTFSPTATGQDTDFWNPARTGVLLKPKQGLLTVGTFTGTLGIVSFDVIQVAEPYLWKFLILCRRNMPRGNG